MADKQSKKAAEPRGIQSVEVAFRVIAPFLASPGPFTLRYLAEKAGMSPTSLHFYLVSLVRTGLLVRNEAGNTFALGSTAIHLGLAALANIDAVQAAREPMQSLRDELGTPVCLSIWSDKGPIIVLHLPGLRTSYWTLQVGAVLPPLSAAGRAILAYFPPPLQKEVIARALKDSQPEDPWHASSVEQILAVLKEIRRTGISPRSGAVVPGFASIASPILNAEGVAVAALTVVANTPAFDDRPEGQNAEALLRVAQQISLNLGASHDKRFPRA
ncbi:MULTISPECIES: IclR family transcriptional regulator [unclassified Beijerinckia]|uniref:IclR family transcriptional regulator n=1 Tax=unclassified Beijerinckia TaxID=2638183 RepID=UPI000899C307|nr:MULTISPECIES: IclR family transcriptional regulator [unclassified Beijerinckia]MDH7796080.1 DNA-binding IclR family transcriptional regulator [Beijerinckia sp. GAS462]SEC29381.1 transcriptional regulator, IclR family [Beijerinckia sp. 28-YEA-48]